MTSQFVDEFSQIRRFKFKAFENCIFVFMGTEWETRCAGAVIWKQTYLDMFGIDIEFFNNRLDEIKGLFSTGDAGISRIMSKENISWLSGTTT